MDSSSRALIAVVDDEAPVRKAIARALRLSGHDVVQFGSGEELLASLNSALPACVVIDLRMLGMSGFEAQAQLRANGLKIPVILITASDEPAVQGQAHAAGFAGLLLKPFSTQALHDLIERAIA